MTSNLNRRLHKLGQTLIELQRDREDREHPAPSIEDILTAGRSRAPVALTDEECRERGRQMRAKLRACGVYDRRPRR